MFRGLKAKMWNLRAPVVMSPGLAKHIGSEACCDGVFRPIVYVDPMVDQIPGGNAIVMHEVGHATLRHGLRALLWLIFFFPGYWWFRRTAEKEADRWAVRTAGAEAFRAMVLLLPHPKSRWGRFLYGKTKEARLLRAGVPLSSSSTSKAGASSSASSRATGTTAR